MDTHKTEVLRARKCFGTDNLTESDGRWQEAFGNISISLDNLLCYGKIMGKLSAKMEKVQLYSCKIHGDVV